MYLEHLTTALRSKFDSEVRGGIHVSDLVMCVRRNALKRIEPTPVTMKELNFFTSGRAIGDALQTLAGYDSNRFKAEHEVEWNGIVAHIDIYDSQNNIPIECKSMRVKEVKEPKSHHVDQLKSYMVMVGSNKGVLLYQCLMHFEDKPFVEFEITMTEAEMAQHREWMIVQAEYFRVAVESKDAMTVKGVLKDPELNWLCISRDGKPNCPYYDRCKAEKEANP